MLRKSRIDASAWSRRRVAAAEGAPRREERAGGEKCRRGGRIGAENLSRGGWASFDRSIFNPSPNESARQQRLLQTGGTNRPFLPLRPRPRSCSIAADVPPEEGSPRALEKDQRVLLSHHRLLFVQSFHPFVSRARTFLTPSSSAAVVMEGKKVEQYYTPPPKLGKWEGFRVFVWNSETGQFLGRTGASWGESSSLAAVHFTAVYSAISFSR